MLTGSLFDTFCQNVMSFAKDELTIELNMVDCPLRPQKLFVSLNSLDNILLHFVFNWCFLDHFPMLYHLLFSHI